jgi:hypothetical protein
MIEQEGRGDSPCDWKYDAHLVVNRVVSLAREG